GLASLTLQFQVFVTLALGAAFLKERILPLQVLGALLGFAGFGVVASHTSGDVTAAGLACLLCAAVAWGFGNLISRRLGRTNPLSLVVWGGLVPLLPMGIAAWIFE